MKRCEKCALDIEQKGQTPRCDDCHELLCEDCFQKLNPHLKHLFLPWVEPTLEDEMLAMLQRAVGYLGYGADNIEFVKEIEALISKAKGTKP